METICDAISGSGPVLRVHALRRHVSTAGRIVVDGPKGTQLDRVRVEIWNRKPRATAVLLNSLGGERCYSIVVVVVEQRARERALSAKRL